MEGVLTTLPVTKPMGRPGSPEILTFQRSFVCAGTTYELTLAPDATIVDPAPSPAVGIISSSTRRARVLGLVTATRLEASRIEYMDDK